MDRTSAKHSARVDDELKKETQSLTRGSPIESRVEEGREMEGPADGDYDVDARTSSGLGADDVESRRELSRHLRPSAFPADRAALLAAAADEAAPEAVLQALRRLPEGQEYATMHEVWAAVTGSEDPAEAARHDPLAH
jgi:hypothetical protein